MKSISSDVIHRRPEQYIAEMLMVNKNPVFKEMPAFWRNKENKESYMGFVLNCRRHIREVGFDPIFNAIKKHNLTDLKEQSVQLIIEELLKSKEV